MFIRSIPVFLLLGCAGGDTDTDLGDTDAPTGGLALIGSWTDDFGGQHDITESTWTMAVGGVFHVEEYDNDDAWLIAHNDEGNDFSAGLWSRMDWQLDGANAWFCQSAFDAADADAARATPAADGADPATGGCGGFPWSLLTPR